MALRSEYSLGHSQFNDFLFAYVGEEKEGLEVTVLSALARLGLDPWEEAARLSTLSEEAATSALTATIARVPEGNWRSEEHTSELQSLMRISYAVFCLTKQNTNRANRQATST